MAKKKENLSPEDLLEQALVPECEWPYQVPENWVWIRGSHIFDDMTTKKPTGEYFYYIDIDAIDNKNQVVKEAKRISVSEAPSRASRGLSEGDTLFSLVRPYLMNIAYVDQDLKDCIASTGFYVCRPKPNLNSKYFFRLMTSNYVVDGLNTFMKGDNSPSIRSSDITGFFYPLPPLAEQQRIVDRIESLFEKLDQSKWLIQDALDSFENRKAAILHKAFSGELTKRWREVNGIGMESWEEKTLGEIIKVSSGQGLTSQNMNPVGRIPVFGGNGVTGYHDKSTVNIPTIVIGRVGFYCGSVHFINEPAWVTDNALIVKFNEKQINITFLYWLLSHTDLRENDSSTAQPVISGSKIYPIIVKLPPYSEQQEIVTIIESVLAKEQSAKEFCDIVESINLMKKSILARAFRGELGTNNLDEYSSLDLVKTIVMEDNTTSQNPPNSSKGKKTFEENVNMKKTIFEVLSEHKRVTPERLKILSGINNIDVFYAELKTLVDNGEVIEIREREESFLEVNNAGR